MEVTVTDNGAGNLTDIQTISVSINDVNDAPVITSNGGGPTALLSIDENTVTVTTVTATDQDADTLTYSISGGSDQAKFNIDATSGALTFANAPDYENPTDTNSDNTYIVEVTVTDNGAGNLTDIQTISVSIVDVSGNAPNITSNNGLDEIVVFVEENTHFVTKLEAVSESGHHITFSITGGADSLSFVLAEVSNRLEFLEIPDFESPASADGDNNYTLEITATDTSPEKLTDKQYLSVLVVNKNEPVSIVSDGGGQFANISINENTLLVTTVIAQDQDDDAITYALSGGIDKSKFSINQSTGLITFKNFPDFETPTDHNLDNTYIVQVTATDHGVGNLWLLRLYMFLLKILLKFLSLLLMEVI